MAATESTTKRRLRLAQILILGILLLLSGSLISYFGQNARMGEARREHAIPQVAILHPVQGEQLPANQYSYVSAQVGSRIPIRSMEIWVDGQLLEILESGFEEGTLQMGRTFDLLVGSGPHSLVVRAFDTQGQVGQSLPVSFSGFERTPGDNLYFQIDYSPEVSLEQLGEEFQVDPEEIVAINPEVFGEGIPENEESQIWIPISPSQMGEGDTHTPEEAIAEETVLSQAAGKICYPSEQIPPMTAFFQNTQTKAVASLSIAANQTQYSVALPPGTYTAYAWLLDKSLGGTYSKAVPCGLDVSCTDHTPLPFTVQSDQTTQGIDICDWYSPADVPAPAQPSGNPSSPAQPEIPSNIPMLEVAELLPGGNASSLPWAIFLPNKLPDAPTGLKAALNGCQLQLTWNSNPQEIKAYQVWYTTQKGVLTLQATLKAPQGSITSHWYTFTPSTAGQVTVWVEALNALGSQASTPAVVTLPESCGGASSGNLEFRTLQVKAAPGYDRVYAYLSLEGLPEQRIPADDSEFIRPEGERSNANRYAPAFNKYILALPKDDSLTLQGECWGWSGGSLNLLSQFEEIIPASQWDGTQGQLGNELCLISYQVQSSGGPGSTMETYGGNNLVIPPPFNLKVDRTKWASDDATATDSEQFSWWWEREVKWQWKGNIKDINGFTIYLNGSALKTVPANLRSAYVILPANCGPGNKWEVTANGKEGTAPKSQPVMETMPQCSHYLKVILDYADWMKTCEDFICHWNSAPCDTFEAYFTISVNSVVRSYFGGNIFMPLNCGWHYFYYMVEPNGEVFFIIPFNNDYTDVVIAARFWDYDELSADDYLGVGQFTLTWPNFSYGESYIKKFGTITDNGPTATFNMNGPTNDSVHGVVMKYYVILYPNVLQKNP